MPRSPTSRPRASEVPQAKTSPFAHDGPPEDFGKDQLVFVRMPCGLKGRRQSRSKQRPWAVMLCSFSTCSPGQITAEHRKQFSLAVEDVARCVALRRRSTMSAAPCYPTGYIRGATDFRQASVRRDQQTRQPSVWPSVRARALLVFVNPTSSSSRGSKSCPDTAVKGARFRFPGAQQVIRRAEAPIQEKVTVGYPSRCTTIWFRQASQRATVVVMFTVRVRRLSVSSTCTRGTPAFRAMQSPQTDTSMMRPMIS